MRSDGKVLVVLSVENKNKKNIATSIASLTLEMALVFALRTFEDL
jgi:hypothetical protein